MARTYEKLDVVLASMPFAPAHTPSLGLELLKAAVPTRSIRTLYFTIAFARQFGGHLYSLVIERDISLIGEWLFSPALFDTNPGEVEPFLSRVALTHERPLPEADLEALVAARAAARAFVDECAEQVLAHGPALVGLTSVFQQHVASLALARRLKTLDPSVRVVIGGANCDAAMGQETAKQFPFLDAVVSGEADAIFADLVERALIGAPLCDLPGVLAPSRLEHTGTGGSSPSPRVRMDDLPVPDFDDFFSEWDRAEVSVEIRPKVLFETSRGCWWGEKHHCTFCGLNAVSMSFRSKSPGRVLSELEQLVSRYPGRPVFVVDNILDMRYFANVLPALAEGRLPVTLFFEVKANLRKAQLRLMRAAGILDIQPGIESLSGPVLELMRKGVTPLQNIQTLKWCAELGIATHWNWLWGFPLEPVSAYAELEKVVPRLTHLQPPRACGPIRLHRFSPNFTEHERHGFSAVRAAPGYSDVYPLPPESIANLAYHFEGIYADGRDPSTYTAGLQAAIEHWQHVYPECELLAVDRGEELWVFDSRPGFGGLTMLSGIDRVLYRACDSIRSIEGLTAFAARYFGSRMTPDEVRDRLSPCLEGGLIIEDGGRFLALAVMRGVAEEEDAVWQSALDVGVDSSRVMLPMT